jgi:hypothetical protein
MLLPVRAAALPSTQPLWSGVCVAATWSMATWAAGREEERSEALRGCREERALMPEEHHCIPPVRFTDSNSVWQCATLGSSNVRRCRCRACVPCRAAPRMSISSV